MNNNDATQGDNSAKPRFSFPTAFTILFGLIIFVAALTWIIPAGQYDRTKLVNLGANRWSFKPEAGISRAAGPLFNLRKPTESGRNTVRPGVGCTV